jgi:two-component system, NarL family, response regulator DevR
VLRILVVDDHPPVIDSLVRRLSAEPELVVVATARSLVEAHAALDRPGSDIDLVVCDVQMGGDAEGLRLLEQFGGRPVPRFLMLSAFDYPTLIRAAHERGASGYLIKTAELFEIVGAVRAVGSGGTAFSSSALRSIRSAPRRPSEREIEVIELVVRGSGNDEIARSLVLSQKTVESHLRRLFNRYGLMNRTELAVLAMREGWVEAPVEPREAASPR